MIKPSLSAAPTIWPDSQLVLPTLLDTVVRSMEDKLALPSAVGIALALQTISSALGRRHN
ncbi:MAG: hypothetical protein EB141_14660 [Verrucomicrobia bacterium]|nr:hypothetical protein [Verrucomicrobiota bacterium]NBU10240.1 hypothetical protein [Pseudomonadota bacterium]NDA65873.1 hypothetical protein [Verrucomicrobiota bacterium]NDB76856.1 hypothetical protein [Verrucomicrobiota bacterium]NDD37768.1 hypothetical protein [Verrucomicrobiota bacterium]